MNLKYKILFFLLVFSFYSSCLINPIKAIPFVGNLYGSIGYSINDNHVHSTSKDKNNNVLSSNIGDQENVNLAVGIASNIPLPIIDNLRLQVNYIKSLKSVNNNLLGVGFYYDIKKIPIITPYLGITLFNYNPKLILHMQKENTIKSNINQGLTAFNVGLNLGLPLMPLGIYLEYNYAIPGLFNNKLNFIKNDIKYNSKDLSLHMFHMGIKFYFL